MALTKVQSEILYYGKAENKDERMISLYTGDLSTLTKEDGVDYLCVSALPNDYSPIAASLIQSLYNHGISVKELAKNKLVDNRPDIPCWISNNVKGAGFKRIAVFEPANPSSQAEKMISYLFSAICSAQGNNSSDIRVALPLVCTGSGGADEMEMMDAIFFAAVHWCCMKFPFREIKLVLRPGKKNLDKLKQRFDSLIQQYRNVDKLDFSGYAHYVAQAKSRISKIDLPDGLSERQAMSICVYTSDFYRTINSILRKESTKSENYKKLRPLIEAIDTGLMNLSSFQNLVYRGEIHMSEERKKENQIGNDVTNLAYTSSSYKTGSYYYRPFRFQFQSLTGAAIDSISLFPSEKEVLFAEGMSYHVNDIKVDPDYTLYDCNENAQKFRR